MSKDNALHAGALQLVEEWDSDSQASLERSEMNDLATRIAAYAQAAGTSAPADEAEKLKKNIASLLKQIGDAALCKACGQEIWFVRMRSGKLSPITADGISHFSNCPAGQLFRKGKAA